MRRTRGLALSRVAAALVLAVLASGCQPDSLDSAGSRPLAQVPAAQPVSTAAPASRASVAASAPKPKPARPMLRAADNGDGDSWKDTQGREYRLGMVNTPEYDECYGSAATAKRKAMTAGGFRAAVYATDQYGRSVAVITTARGVNLNVWLARHGYADDRYLSEFRHENPGLARQLDVAFAAAKRDGAGLWSACGATGTQGVVAPPPASGSGCHPDYVSPCVPIKGDGSGDGAANDLDCGDIRQKVKLRAVGVDPYRFDNDGDGWGCDSY